MNNNCLAGVIIQDRVTGELKELHCVGVFVITGLSPNTSLVTSKVETDPYGFVVFPSYCAPGAVKNWQPGSCSSIWRYASACYLK